MEHNISANKKLILRISRYCNSLNRFKSLGFVKVFSDNIADSVGVSPTQVRKDFSVFGLPGNKRGGYLIDELLLKMNEILGKNRQNDVIVIGAGNLGTALIKYEIFKKEGIKIVAGFDIDQSKVNEEQIVPIYHIDILERYIKDHNILIAILTVPETAAQGVTDMIIKAGIKGILNFSPVNLRCPEDTIVNNIYLQTELESLIYFVNATNKSKKK
jgi:redox-sensing transcriptional repressor